MMAYEPWLEWTITDEEEGGIIGIRDDAPEDMKKAYAEYLKIATQTDETGRIIRF